jgi:hypothetical protein
MKIGGIVIVGGYLAIGALVHWALLGPSFHVASVASWGVVFAWPFVLIALGLLIGLTLWIAIGSVIAAIEWLSLVRQVNRNQRAYKR